MAEARMKLFGWGREGEAMTVDEENFVLDRYRQRFGVDRFEEIALPKLEELKLPVPRISPPASLASFCSSETHERARHTYGKSYPDTVRGLDGDYSVAPDVVAFPRVEADVVALLDWADKVGA